jgi:hypothetical protein
VAWGASSGAASYEVWRHTSNSSASATRIATSVVATSYNDISAAFGTTYYYWVKAKNTAGTSGFSASDSGYRALPLTVCVDDGNGTGQEDGTAQHPFNTIQEGIVVVADGGTVKVARGAYTGNVIIADKRVDIVGGYVGRTTYPGTGDFSEVNRDPDPATNQTVLRGIPTLAQIMAQNPAARGSRLLSFRVRSKASFHLIVVRAVIMDP